MTKKIDAENVFNLGLCYSLEYAQAISEQEGKGPDDEWTADEVLTKMDIPYDDAMYFLLREDFLSAEVMKTFAAQVTKDELAPLMQFLGKAKARPFIDAVEAIGRGEEDLTEHAEATHKAITSSFIPTGWGDASDPEKVENFKRRLAGAKAIRGACKPDPGMAAYAAANAIMTATPKDKRDNLGWKHRGLLAKIYRDSL